MFLGNIVHGFPEELKGLGLLPTYAICDNGVWQIKPAGCGHVITKMDGVPCIGTGPKSDFNTILPRKMPYEGIYKQIVSFFRAVLEKFGSESLEAFILVLYNPDKNTFFLHVPPHTVSGGSVSYDVKDVWQSFPGCYVVLDVHSHHVMGSYFSGTDDADDNRDRYSGVIGKINNVIPEFNVRFGTNGNFYNFSLDDIFEDTDEKITVLDVSEGLARVSCAVRKPPEVISENWWTTGRNTGAGIARSGYQGLLDGFRNRLTVNNNNEHPFWEDEEEEKY